MQTTLPTAPRSPDADGFEKKARQIGEWALAFQDPLIVHHLDCDGLTSAALAKKAFQLKGKNAPTLMLKKLDDASAKSIPPDKELVFTDLGAGQLELVEGMSNPKKVVIDHHPPSKDSDIERINCHDFEFDGAVDACSASTAWYCFRHTGLSAQLGIVGAVGDMQDQNGFQGLNQRMFQEAVNQGQVLHTNDLKLFGKVTRSLVSFLTYCTEPVLPGLTGDDKACAVFLKNEGVPTYRDGKTLSYYGLNVFERKKLASALIQYAYAQGVEEKLIRQMVGDVYVFPFEPEGSERKEAYEFSTLLNACGRHDAPQIGIGACLGQDGALQQAQDLLKKHRLAVRQGIEFAKKNAVDAGAFYLIDGRGTISDTIIGVVCGAYFSSGLVQRTKPVIGLSVDEQGALKASGRGSKDLCTQGLDLGEAMKKAAEDVQGFGGGHAVAAGASLDATPENVKTFLKKIKQVVEVQLQLR
ncbi:DHH family phosphoesterase [Candidatus Micrarchaeota archaeon]|nr:DHH family phosphoesterase [Candidatus Micrarchaeota archaeon]